MLILRREWLKRGGGGGGGLINFLLQKGVLSGRFKEGLFDYVLTTTGKT